MSVVDRIKVSLRPFRLYRAARFAWHFATDRVFRRDHVVWWRRPPGHFQYRSFTSRNRYPRIFAFVRDQLADQPAPRLLSFGCATGEEVFSLHDYLPRAFVKGIDLNQGNVEICRDRVTPGLAGQIVFAHQGSAASEPPESYDAIFCMAVFQHSALKDPAVQDCGRLIRFEAFAAELAAIARAIRPGGYLAIRHADFRFSDTDASAGFDPVLRLPPVGLPHVRFDRHNRRLPPEHDTDVVFQKRI